MGQRYYDRLYSELCGKDDWYRKKRIVESMTQDKITPQEGYRMIKQLTEHDVAKSRDVLEQLIEQSMTQRLKPSTN